MLSRTPKPVGARTVSVPSTTLKQAAKRFWQPVAILIFLMVAIGLAFAHHGSTPNKLAPSTGTNCGVYRNDKPVYVGSTKIIAETANNLAETQKGLAGRSCITPDRGMLFGFTKPGYYTFWMKDMTFPIDIIWIGPDYKTVAIQANVQPSTYPHYKFTNQTRPAQYVLELKANRSKELNIKLGTPINF